MKPPATAGSWRSCSKSEESFLDAAMPPRGRIFRKRVPPSGGTAFFPKKAVGKKGQRGEESKLSPPGAFWGAVLAGGKRYRTTEPAGEI